MSDWKEYLLGELLQLQRGFDITTKEQQPGNVPVISSSGITSYHKKAMVQGPGVITGRKGSLGKVHFVQSDYWPHDTTLWIKDFKGNNPKFLYYLLQQIHLENYDVGASNPTLNRNHLHKIKLNCPPPPIQQKIAAIISAYDDLIENNNKRIALLEKAADEIYREWFVRMRFPGWERVKFEKGVPEGWEVIELGKTIKLTMGQSPSSEFYNESGDGLPFHQGVGTYGERFPKNKIFCSVPGRMAKKGDILFSVRAPVGRLNIADCDLIIGRGLAAMRHKENKNSYLYYLLKYLFAEEDRIGNGAIFASVSKDELQKFKILNPEMSLIDQFENYVSKIDRQIENLYRSNAGLIKSRDLLLSRLISGKLPVDDLDIRFPPSMEGERAG
jgi:type I restriction enzyme S subunit